MFGSERNDGRGTDGRGTVETRRKRLVRVNFTLPQPLIFRHFNVIEKMPYADKDKPKMNLNTKDNRYYEPSSPNYILDPRNKLKVKQNSHPYTIR